GRRNFRCPYQAGRGREISCDNRALPCKRPVDWKHGEKRIDALRECPCWGFIFPSGLADSIKGARKVQYEGIKGKWTWCMKGECPYWKQFQAYVSSDAIVMNSAKWAAELSVGRLPEVPITVVDEADHWLDSLAVKVSVTERTISWLQEEVRRSIESSGLDEDSELEDMGEVLRDLWSDVISGKGDPLKLAEYLVELLDEIDETSGELYWKLRSVLEHRGHAEWDIQEKGIAYFVPDPKIVLQGIFDKVGGKWLLMSATCIPPESIVMCNGVPKPVSEIRKGEVVIGKSGQPVKVINTFSRYYEGDLVMIKPCYLPSLELTPDHPVLAVKRPECVQKSWREMGKKCRPDCKHKHHYKYCKNLGKESFEPEWIEASRLKKGDWVIFPKYRETNQVEWIDLAEYIPKTGREKMYQKAIELRERYGTGVKRISQDVGLPVNIVEGWVYYGKSPGLFKIDEGFIWNKGTTRALRRKVPVDEKLMEIFGWYISEGYSTDYRVYFSLGSHEPKNVKNIIDLMEEKFNIHPERVEERKDEHTVIIRFNSIVLAKFFSLNFGKGAIKKIIPQWVLGAPPVLLKRLLFTMMEGDGCRRSGNVFEYSTSSKILPYQLFLIGSKIGIIPFFTVDKRESRKTGNPLYKVAFTINATKRLYYEDEDYYYIPIRKLEMKKYSGIVHNLETVDNTYLSPFVVHNCQSPEVLKDVFEIEPVFVEGETRFPGELVQKRIGTEKAVNYRRWADDKFRREYWGLFTKIMRKAKRPGFVPIHAFKYLPPKLKEKIRAEEDEVHEHRDIMFTTKMDRGADLKGIKSIILLKFPYPAREDPLLKGMERRLGSEAFRRYYRDIAGREFVQQIGRVLRSEDDVAEFWSPDNMCHAQLGQLWKGSVSSQQSLK
ncbi:MAG: helicase C-terminal domain-containing protein, partial [Hadesarchaea archaeon]|nr:helicase C-terminal domain-containing protein [Hadesarchaea archaeon]